MSDSIEVRLKNFKKDMRGKITDNGIVRKYITFGTPYVFEDDEYQWHGLRSIVADQFKIDDDNVYMVGSAKLGFSIVSSKLLRTLQDDSDIDIAIISDGLFDSFWKELLDFNIGRTVRTEAEQQQYKEFLEYFFKGWLRPDKFPFKYENREKWFTFFKSISYKEYGKRKVSAAIYREKHFFVHYHMRNIKYLRETMRGVFR